MNHYSIAMEFLWALLMLLLATHRTVKAAATTGCPATCGNVSVPYPFGIKTGCARVGVFNLSCDETSHPPMLSVFGMGILEIIVGRGQMRVTTFQDLITGGAMLTTGHYSVSEESAVLKWVVDNVSCEDAMKNRSSYACVSSKSLCYTDINATYGYHCECDQGYQGNPYVFDGCQDINECEHPEKLQNCTGVCINTQGGYNCICPSGSILDQTQQYCINTHGNGKSLVFVLLMGVCTGTGLLLLLIIILYFYRKWKETKLKKLKKKNFNRNRGFLLQQLVSSSEDAAERMKIISLEELEKATNQFDESRILGKGGHGTVYKGILSDQRIVAIKRSRIAEQSEIDQFINELVILSQINHRNVIKLLGCCLEAEVPLLVYEFVSNGTLFDHLHNWGHSSSLPWEDRLRIATETAGALAYMHSAASISIFHRDIKSSNILLDDNFTTKVSDFGASRGIPVDQTSITTMVQGTFGYLDPEYYQTSQLTEKSDVYSFGVILAELLTGEKPVSLGKSEEQRNLAAHFIHSLEQNNLFQLVETRVMEEAKREEIEGVAKLAEVCLRLKGEERPTMKEVEEELNALRRYNGHQKHPWSARNHAKSKYLLSDLPKEYGNSDLTRQYTLEKEFLLSIEYAR